MPQTDLEAEEREARAAMHLARMLWDSSAPTPGNREKLRVAMKRWAVARAKLDASMEPTLVPEIQPDTDFEDDDYSRRRRF